MIITEQKPFDKIKSMLEKFNKVFIIGCGECATLCQTGGEDQVKEMKEKLKGLGKEVTGTAVPKTTCDKRILRRDLKKFKEAIEAAQAILVMACGNGVQTVAEFTGKLVVPALNTLFMGKIERIGRFYERCRACGDCILFETGGVCPLTQCAKGLLNGPCGGYANGKCEVGGWVKDCAWIKIFNALKEQGRLDLFLKFRPPKDHRKWFASGPRELVWKERKETKAEEGEVWIPGERWPPKETYSELMKKLKDGEFVITGEVEPVKTTRVDKVLEACRTIKDYVVAVNVTDNPTAFAYLNTLTTCYYIEKEVGLETIYQITVRDRNRLAITSDLLAAGLLGIKNVLALSGDFISVGDNPQAKPVYDIDSTQLVWLIRKIVDKGEDIAGNKIDHPPKLHVGIAANPNAEPLEPELYKVLRKQKVGAEFIQTQCVYDIEVLKKFLDEARSIGIKLPVLVGVTPFKSLKMMEWMVKFVPGIKVPEEMQERLRKARERGKEAFREENLEIFGELCKEIKKTPGVAGIHMMAVGFEEIMPSLLKRAGLA